MRYILATEFQTHSTLAMTMFPLLLICGYNLSDFPFLYWSLGRGWWWFLEGGGGGGGGDVLTCEVKGCKAYFIA